MAKTRTKKPETKVEVEPLMVSTENHTSNTPLMIDADGTAASMKSLASMIDALRWLHELLGKGTATVGTRHNALGIARSDLRHVEKLLGAEEDLSQENDRRLHLLRSANAEVHRLREELGNGVTVAAIGSKLYKLDRTIYNWWQNLGFTYSKSVLQPHSQGASFKVEFSVRIERHVSTMSTKPVTEKALVDAKRKELGEFLEIAYDGDEPHVVDNENNRAWITAKLKSRFPTCRIWKWESHSVYRLDLFEIIHVEANIDMTDVGEYEKGRYD